jgi:large subunit ribosomal protein L17
MRHRKYRINLNRFTSWRRATLISLSKNLLISQSIRTTSTKAKSAKPLVEKLITLGKRNNLASRREAFSILQDHRLVQLLFSEIAPRFNNQNSGFCRILPLGFRRGDGADLAVLELTQKIEKKKKPKKSEEAQPKPKEEITKPTVKPATKPPLTEKPTRKFIGGLRKIFKKERDSL